MGATAEFRLLSDNEIKDLLTKYSNREIGIIHNLDKALVSIEISKRQLFKGDIMRISLTGFKDKYEYMPKEDEFLDFGSWMNSKERISINQYKKI